MIMCSFSVGLAETCSVCPIIYVVHSSVYTFAHPYILQAEEEEEGEESAAGIRSESDEVENVTRSSLGLVPSIEDDGEKITCKAENPWVPRTFVEDSWVLHVVCKTSHKSCFFFLLKSNLVSLLTWHRSPFLYPTLSLHDAFFHKNFKSFPIIAQKYPGNHVPSIKNNITV